MWGAPARSQVRPGRPITIASETDRTGNIRPVLLLPFSRPAADEIDRDTSDDKRRSRVSEGGVPLRHGEHDPAVAHEHARYRFERLPWSGKDVIEHGIPEEELEQDRDVLHDLDVDTGELRDEPVRRKPGDPEEGPQDHRQDDPDKGNLQGVQHPDRERLQVGVGRRVFDQRFADLEGGLLMQESEPRGDRLLVEVRHGVREEVVPQESDHGERHDLVGDRTYLRVM